MSVRFVMIGGFLGAGKTTTLARLARMYQEQGLRVGLVTNDQAHDLVDTNSLRAQGFTVKEVPGACFCCRFDDLIERVKGLEAENRPDIILAEPVGSCTDLVATVVQPLKDLYAGQLTVSPYVVLFKPSHGLRILKNLPGTGFSPKAAYIFRKQLEEADAIVLNRMDEMSPEEADTLTELVEREFPNIPVIRASATTGAGFDHLLETLGQQGPYGRKILSIDYDIYAEGEAELGWLNASVRLAAQESFDLDALLMDLIGSLHAWIRHQGGGVAHLKVIGQDDGGAFGVANLVSDDTTAVLSLPSRAQPREADLTVNARVAIDPAELEARVRQALTELAQPLGIDVQFRAAQSLRPGRPVPTHRYTEAR